MPLDSGYKGNVTNGAALAGWSAGDGVEAWMADGEGGDGLEGRVLALARGGMGRVEIAAVLGLTEDELAALEAEQPGFAVAMRRAEVLEEAWWEGLPREALAGGHRRFNLAGWLGVMRWRRGEDPGAPAAPPPAKPKVRYDIPDNGRERGRALHDSYYNDRDEAWWRDEEIRETDADVRRAEEALRHTLGHVRDEERGLAELRAKLTWLREAPLDAEAPEEFLADGEETDDDDGWK